MKNSRVLNFMKIQMLLKTIMTNELYSIAISHVFDACEQTKKFPTVAKINLNLLEFVENGEKIWIDSIRLEFFCKGSLVARVKSTYSREENSEEDYWKYELPILKIEFPKDKIYFDNRKKNLLDFINAIKNVSN